MMGEVRASRCLAAEVAGALRREVLKMSWQGDETGSLSSVDCCERCGLEPVTARYRSTTEGGGWVTWLHGEGSFVSGWRPLD